MWKELLSFTSERYRSIPSCLVRGATWALLRQQGEITKSRHCTEQALKLDDTDGCLWGNYGNVLRDQDQLEESCQAFKEGLKRAPGSKGLLQGLAISFGRLGEHQKVIELLTPIVDRSLNDSHSGDNALADLLLELGNAHHALGQDELALKRWHQGTHGAEGKSVFYRAEYLPSALWP